MDDHCTILISPPCALLNPTKIDKDECITSLNDGMEQCDLDSYFSHGHTATIGCLDYSIDLSCVVQDESPPWNESVGWLAPEFAPKIAGGLN